MANQVEKYTIDATQIEQALQRTDELAKLMKKSLAEIGVEFKQLSTTTVSANGTLEQYAGSIEKKGTPSLREFRREQRMQDYVLRESTQSMTNLVFALGFLTSGNKDAESTSKKVTMSLMAGVAAQNSMEFAMFGVQRAAAKMNGPLGSILSKVSKFGPEISIVVGLTSAFIAFFSSVNEAAQKASDEGLSDFAKRFSELRPGEKKMSMTAIDALIKGESDKYKTIQNAPVGSMTIWEQNKQLSAIQMQLTIYEDLKREAQKILDYDTARAKVNEAANKAITAGSPANDFGYLIQSEETTRRNKAPLGLGSKGYRNTMTNLSLGQPYQFGGDIVNQIIAGKPSFIQEAQYNPNLAGDLQNAQLKKQQLDYEIEASRNEDDRRKKIEERNQLEIEMSRMMMSQRDLQLEFLSDLSTGLSALDQGMAAIGIKSEDMLGKLIKAAQYAIKIAELTNNTSSAGNTMSIIGNVLGIVGLAGKVEGSGAINPTGAASNTMHYLSSPVSVASPSVQVILVGTLEGQTFLRRTMPGYTRFEGRKAL